MIIVLMSTMAIKKSLSFTGILLLWNQGSVSAAGARLRSPDMQEWRGFHIKSSTMEAEQSSSSKVTKSQWGKVILKPSLPPGICNTGEKNPYHIYWLCFHFPSGESIIMRKEMKGDCFLPSALSTQLILLGGQISAVPAKENRKWVWSIRNKMISDPCLLQWGSVAVNNTPQLIIHLQMKAGTQRMTSIHGVWAILEVCPWLHWEMEHAGSTREAYLESL